MQGKMTKNVHGKSHSQQRMMSSKATNGKKPVKESEANPMLLIGMTQANPKFVMGKPMLTVDALKQVGKSCVELHNYYINNYKKSQDIIASFKEEHFHGIFLISWSDLYNPFNLNMLDISLMHCFTL
jgi:hypothetical protein